MSALYRLIKTIKILGLCMLVFASSSCITNRAGKNTVAGSKTKKVTGKEDVEFKKLFFNANKEKILGNNEDAAALFAQCIRKDPNSSASMFELSRLYLDAGKLSEALFFAENAAEIDPENIWYHYSLAEMYLVANKADKAVKTYEKIISLFPENLTVYYDLADALLKGGKPNAAIKVYDQIERQVGVVEEICLQKEMIYISLNKIDKAAEEMQKLIDEYPKELRYYGMLAELYQANNQMDLALLAYENMLNIEPNDPNVHMSLAGYYKSVGNNTRSL